MTGAPSKHRVGELRPSQILFTFGVGAVVDLPSLSVMVMGLDDWDVSSASTIVEERLLATIQAQEGLESVARLYAPPVAADETTPSFGPATVVGVPVVPFPRWMVCPWCRLLAPLESGLFVGKFDPVRPDRSRYVHVRCSPRSSDPIAFPARFLVACKNGHLDDFPWRLFVHRGPSDCKGALHLQDNGVSGEITDIFVRCAECEQSRVMSNAFGQDAVTVLPGCRARWPHLREYADSACDKPLRTILLGASNSWFPVTLSTLAIPTQHDRLAGLVEAAWGTLAAATSLEVVRAFREIGRLPTVGAYPDEEIWAAIEAYRAARPAAEAPVRSLRAPEWEVLTSRAPTPSSPDFLLTPVAAPTAYKDTITRVVLVERMREVQALVGFTRIESPGDLADLEEFPPDRRAPLSRHKPTWVPASEVRGEGIFIEFDEDAIARWEASPAPNMRTQEFLSAHQQWRYRRGLEPTSAGFPALRYILLHSFAHALMRQFVLECGYSAASVRERIYALPPDADDGPMAGVFIYTAAPDSEGTLGGLVSLGKPALLGRHLKEALRRAGMCSSDPYCSEHSPSSQMLTLHGAACHSCFFVPETSCERGNRYLDRSLLIETVIPQGRAFYD